MPSRYPLFERSSLEVEPLSRREHDLTLDAVVPLSPSLAVRQELGEVGGYIRTARERGASVILMMGAHVIRSGVQRYLIDLMEQGYISCIATNGAGVIHDYELALIGATTESVARYIRDGRFGMWQETGRINDIVSEGAAKGFGLGEAVGKAIEEGQFPHRETSVLAAGYRLGIPVTSHVGIGCDIIHQHPNFDGGAFGQASYTDFLIYTKVLENITGGVVMNFGSAVMGPEIYLKALSMVRNKARGTDDPVVDFTTLVCDLACLPETYRDEACKSNPQYYFRPWKTMLARTVADGGRSYYVQGRHAETVPELWTGVTGGGQ